MVNKTLLEKLKKNTTIKQTHSLEQSILFQDVEEVPTEVPALNVALSGRLDGGITPGITIWAGESKRFKTSFSLLMGKTYLDKYEDAVILFYDSEFGSPMSFFDSFGIDTSRVIHTPITDIEELKFDLVNQLENIERDDHVIIIIDSLGNLASKKERDDALDAKSVADMTRSKSFKSLFRIITPHLKLKNIPLVGVNHTYKSMSLYPTDVVSGGTGSMYSADNVFIVGRKQEKKEKEIEGYHFIIKVEKSRFVKEKKNIPITVNFDKGISKFSGLLELALLSGHVVAPKKGWYSHPDSDKKYRAADLNNKEFWQPILEDETFQQYIEDRYKLSIDSIIEDDDIDAEISSVEGE